MNVPPARWCRGPGLCSEGQRAPHDLTLPSAPLCSMLSGKVLGLRSCVSVGLSLHTEPTPALRPQGRVTRPGFGALLHPWLQGGEAESVPGQCWGVQLLAGAGAASGKWHRLRMLCWSCSGMAPLALLASRVPSPAARAIGLQLQPSCHPAL